MILEKILSRYKVKICLTITITNIVIIIMNMEKWKDLGLNGKKPTQTMPPWTLHLRPFSIH